MLTKLNRTKSAERIDRAIEEAGLTTKDVAAKLGVNLTSVYKWRSGKDTPNIDNLLTIADITDMDIHYFLPVIRGIPTE